MKDNDLKDLYDKIEMLEKSFDCRLTHYKYVLECANSIWEKSPFKVGDLVRLNKTPEITKEKSWGWLGSEHFLIKGALATVKERKFYAGKFVYGIVFNDDSYIDASGNKIKTSEEYIYSFSETWLEPAEYEQFTCEAL
jgi:hypothetical protein